MELTNLKTLIDMKKTAIRDIKLLKEFAKDGHITLHEQTGTKITGLYSKDKFTCYYVEDGKTYFCHNYRLFTVEYISGCFCPYVFEVTDCNVAVNRATGLISFPVIYTERIDQTKYYIDRL